MIEPATVSKSLRFIKWFYPGLKIKRWLFLFIGGVFFFIFSVVHFFLNTLIILKIADVVIFIISLFASIIGARHLLKSFFEAIYPQKERGIIDIIYERRYLSKGPRVVAIGGGTGLSTILEGFKKITSNITVVVTVADEGGSSGRLREEFGILPPGDIRNCLVSLAEAPQLMRDLFQYRFREGNGIKGHSFGNLFITALTEVLGSFQEAVEESSKVLAIRGAVVPSSLERIRLKAEYSDGSTAEGEDKIPQGGKSIKRVYLLPEDVKANPQALQAIEKAEIIILGPGSLFTSVLPNLLIKEMADLIVHQQALKIYICNVMTQYGETDGFTAADHVDVLISHTSKNILNCCLVNCGRLEPKLLVKYAQEKSFPVIPDTKRLRMMGINVFEEDVVSRTNYLRHDPQKIAKKILSIYNWWKENGKSSRRSNR